MTHQSTETAHADGSARPPPVDRNGPDGYMVSDELLQDWLWVYENMGKGLFDTHRGQHIAVVGRRVLASGRDPLQLRERTAVEQNLNPERIAIVYVDMGEC